jgi:hypothetical protein
MNEPDVEGKKKKKKKNVYTVEEDVAVVYILFNYSGALCHLVQRLYDALAHV